MDGMQRTQAQEEHRHRGDTIGMVSSSSRPLKRARSVVDRSSEEEKEKKNGFVIHGSFPLFENNDSHVSTMTSSLITQYPLIPWRLPRTHTFADTQEYLNAQLQHVVAMSSMFLPRSLRQMSMGQENVRERDDVDNVCTLDLVKVWEILAVGAEIQTQEHEIAEKSLRNVLDLVSYLLYVRDREMEHQSQLSERLNNMEKHLERKNHIVHTITSDLETLKQNNAQRENMFKAKEQVLMTERKMLQMEKKALEVHCARLQGVETAYKAQLRRKDVEYARLKKSLQDAVARGAKEKRGMAITKPLNGVQERKQILMNSQSKESKLTKQIIENMERKKAELVVDNETLAKSYDKLQHHLESLTLQYKKAVRLFLAQKNLEGNAEELEKLASAPIDNFTPTPFNMATKAKARSDKEVIKRLRQKLDDAQSIINEQDQLLQASLSAPTVDASVGRKACHSNFTATALVGRVAECRSSPDVNAEEDLAQEKSELAVLRQNLQKERKLLQEQAIKLDKDRLEFEIIKRDQMFGSSVDVACEQASLSISDNATCSTPTQQHRAKRFDLDGMVSPIDIPVSATPETAAYLKKIGIYVPHEK
ncbi:unnamed protein product [Peronospora belbahrii]|uniref:Uncharacterized protein n=1 Tax=Peronospora belbahrii TaxID=622444 RepID=A0AAU9L0E8_9STRA|nr:unnamed protein product [Peronospora belbahrii]